jgi:Threonine synthase N terminus
MSLNFVRTHQQTIDVVQKAVDVDGEGELVNRAPLNLRCVYETKHSSRLRINQTFIEQHTQPLFVRLVDKQSFHRLAPPFKMTSVTYSSTRGGQSKLDFRTVVMQGLAHDRGLFVPDEIPEVSADELEQWRSLNYADLAVEVIHKFVKEDQVPLTKLREIVQKSCAAFRHQDVTPIVSVGGHAVLVRNQRVSKFSRTEQA